MDAVPVRACLQDSPQTRIRTYSTDHRQARNAMMLNCPKRFFDQHVHNGFLVPRSNMCGSNRSLALWSVSQIIQQRGLQAAETEIEPATVQVRTREPDDRWISRLCQTIQGRATGVGKPEHLGPFVKGFSRRIIQGLSKECIVSALSDQIQVRMPTGHHQHHSGRRKSRIFQPRRRDMAFQVMDTDTWNVQGIGEGFAKTHANDQRTGQSRPSRDRDRPKRSPPRAGLSKSVLRHRRDPLNMLPRSKLRHHAAETCVHVMLRRHNIRQQVSFEG